MAFSNFDSEEEILNREWVDFAFFATKGIGAMNLSINPGKVWKLKEVRMHLSVAFGSVQNFIIKLSAVKGSAYNTTLISQAMNTIQDLFILYSTPIVFLSNDCLNVSMFASMTAVRGFTVLGQWAVSN